MRGYLTSFVETKCKFFVIENDTLLVKRNKI